MMIRIEGHVWCDRHGDVHDDTLDPYGYEGSEDEALRVCNPEDHRPVYYRKRKGDV